MRDQWNAAPLSLEWKSLNGELGVSESKSTEFARVRWQLRASSESTRAGQSMVTLTLAS
ncbi:hypothetical protein [Chondromyces crocatus]|uniref:Uncharacterized protein n=1 Tax=Chondromyces crocatus TaxID=52 RepID=A0A0K1ELQ9_CHOCO|nr:hypothetical protein [Chondromyces crocatus]AKT41830.1 uncharacterized protein CMC5_060410 [Chondromyces crocatus]